MIDFEFVPLFSLSAVFGFGLSCFVNLVGVSFHVLFKIVKKAGEVDG